MASGTPILFATALGNEPPTTIAASPDLRNAHPVLDFDAATDEEAVFRGIVPQGYSSGGFTVVLKCAMSTATSGNVVFQAAFENVDGLDIDANSFEAFNGSGQVAAPGTAGTEFDVTITFTNGADSDSIGVGDQFRLKVRRDADSTSATDDATGDAELMAVEVRET